LFHQLASFGGPLFANTLSVPARLESAGGSTPKEQARLASAATAPGPDPALFGRHPNGHSIDSASLCVRAPSVLEVRLPSDLVAGCEFVTTGFLDNETGAEGSVQLQVLTTKPERESGLLPSTVTVSDASGPWTPDHHKIS